MKRGLLESTKSELAEMKHDGIATDGEDEKQDEIMNIYHTRCSQPRRVCSDTNKTHTSPCLPDWNEARKRTRGLSKFVPLEHDSRTLIEPAKNLQQHPDSPKLHLTPLIKPGATPPLQRQKKILVLKDRLQILAKEQSKPECQPRPYKERKAELDQTEFLRQTAQSLLERIRKEAAGKSEKAGQTLVLVLEDAQQDAIRDDSDHPATIKTAAKEIPDQRSSESSLPGQQDESEPAETPSPTPSTHEHVDLKPARRTSKMHSEAKAPTPKSSFV